MINGAAGTKTWVETPEAGFFARSTVTSATANTP